MFSATDLQSSFKNEYSEYPIKHMLSAREIYRRRGLLQERSSFLSLAPDHGEHVSLFWGTLGHLFRGQFSFHFKNSGLRQTVTRHQEYLEEGSRVTRLCQDDMVSKCLVRESAVNKTRRQQTAIHPGCSPQFLPNLDILTDPQGNTV